MRLAGITWAAALILLPVTSLPLLKEISGATTVAPPSSALFLLLAALWLLPYLLSGGRLPVEVKPFLLWVAAGVISWAAALFSQLPQFRDQTLLTQTPETVVTLAMGVSAYLSAAGWISAGEGRLQTALKWISVGGAILIVHSLVQAWFVLAASGHYPGWYVQVQQFISSRNNPLFPTRLTGFAYEPSWLAHMLALVYLPVWLSMVIRRCTAFKLRLGFVTVELVLLLAAIFTLFFTLSRVGLISFSLVLAYLGLRFVLHLSGKLSSRVLSRRRDRQPAAWGMKFTLTAGIMALLLAAILGMVVGFFYLSTKFDPRMQRIFETDFSTTTSLYQLTNQLAFAERAVYWATGMNIFNDHPLLGVGLGGAGLHFPQKMPAYGYALWEVSRLFGFEDAVPNTKSLWVRVLAETGLVGFSIFAGWLFVLWQSGRLAQSSNSRVLQAAGLAGQLAIVAFFAEGFSIDSFALPYIWVELGVLSAAGLLARRTVLDSKREEI